jgi:NAD(P)-dependent dehydrogenase (short-subunit alcohol dehydrogenase family)
MAEAFEFTKTLHHDTYDLISPSKADLAGRIVLITGASRGIGRALAISYTQARASGIILAARGDLSQTQDAISKAAKDAGLPEPKVLPLMVDVTSQSSVEAAATEVSTHFPEGIDIIVSNAGLLEKVTPLAEANVDEWWSSYEVNTKGPFLISRSFLPLLLKKPSGLKSIAIITSIGALMVLPGMSAYNNAKLASMRLAEYIQLEYGSQGIVAFSLHPGGVDTDLARNLDSSMHAMLTETPELAADTVVWLTGERREWVGGRFVNTQWDMGEFEGKKAEIVEKGLLTVGVKF